MKWCPLSWRIWFFLVGLVRRKGPQFVMPRTTPPWARIRLPAVRAILEGEEMSVLRVWKWSNFNGEEWAHSLTSLVLCGWPTRTWQIVSIEYRRQRRLQGHVPQLSSHITWRRRSSFITLKRLIDFVSANTEDYSPRRAVSAVSAICWCKTSQLRFSLLALPFSKHGGYCKLEGAAGGFHTGSITDSMSACQIGRSIAVKTTNDSPHQDWCEVF